MIKSTPATPANGLTTQYFKIALWSDDCQAWQSQPGDFTMREIAEFYPYRLAGDEVRILSVIPE